MTASTFLWNEDTRVAKAAFSIAQVGRLSFEVEAELPGAGPGQTKEERHALALRHAKLLVRNLANELERQA